MFATLRRLLAASTAFSLAFVPLVRADEGCGYGGVSTTLEINPSVIVNDPAILADADFGFARTIGAILSSQGAQDTPANREAFLKTMLNSFNATKMVNPASGLEMNVDARPQEAGLDVAALLDAAGPSGLQPIGLFNRLDLAPADFSNCGEHRVVYSTRSGSPIDRFFLIFEARVGNPAGTGFEGCRPIAEFWASLNDMTPSERADALEGFYYEGLGNGIGPVIQARNYGQPDGQVRGNVFVGFTKWQLREWLVAGFGPAGGTFLPVTVKTNPLAEFYADASDAATSSNPALEETERTAFLTELKDRYTLEVLGVDGTFPDVGPTDPGALEMFKRDLFAGMGANVDGRFDEFQADSQGDLDNPTVLAPAGGRARTAIQPTLAANPLPHNRAVTEEQVLNRMGALSCGGCHQFSNDVEIGTVNGQPVTWPPSAFFVHIDENSQISEALSEWFLPARLENLREAVCEAPADTMAQAEPKTEAPAARAARSDGADSDRYGAVDAAAARVRTSPAARSAAPDGREPEALMQYRDVVEDLREEERDKPGAFVRVRRVH